jgi:hypothetical protein
MGGKGGGGTTIKQPPPIDPGKAMGEYLFGTRFRQDFDGVTDPRLQNRLIAAERQFRPQYAALELADINTFARGLEGGKESAEYKRLEAKLAGLQAGKGGVTNEEAMKIARAAAGGEPVKSYQRYVKGGTGRNFRRKSGYKTVYNRNYKQEKADYDAEVKQIAESLGGSRESQIASVMAEMKQLEDMPSQGGLFDLLEEQSTRAGALQREQLGLQRADDVAALQEFAPQVVDAYRDADPYSTRLADLAADQAESAFERASGPMGFEAQRQVDQSVLGNLGGTAFAQQGRSALEAALGREQYQQGREQFAAGLGQGAFAQSRAIAGDLGSTILGRSSGAIGLGGQMLQQAVGSAAGPMGPQLFDPNVGINMAMSQRSDNMNLLGAQAQADASRSAGKMEMLGSIGGAAIGLMCWVAREVYGPTNPKWKQFRAWVTDDSPSWFLKLYVKYGERFAKFISDKPRLKTIIRKWMDTKIK